MKPWIVAGLLLLSAGAPAPAGEPVDDFALLDTRGVSHQLSRYSEQRAVVLFIQGNACPIVRHSVPALRELREKYEDDGFTFLLLNPQTQDSPADIRAEAKEFDLADFPILVDETQLVAESLGVKRTAEVFVVDAKSMELLYHGPIDDRLHYEVQKPAATERYLDDVLTALLAGEAVEKRELPSPGCIVTFPTRQEHSKRSISYNDEIVPILAKRCISCHTRGGIAPWAMSNHRSIRGWSGMIREVVLTKRMPPGQIDPRYEDRFTDIHRLSLEEEQTLVHWIDAGARLDEGGAEPDEGGLRDALTELERATPEWVLGEPDRILTLPKHEIPATGTLDYVYAPVALDTDQDLWVRALDFRPGDREVLHHLLAYIVPPGVDASILGEPGASLDLLGGYGPGKDAQPLPEGTGRLLPAGSSVLVSLHYTPKGRATTDETRLALYLHDEPPARRLVTHMAGSWDFRIPPGDGDFEVSAHTNPFAEDVLLYSFTPHMHLRGKRMRYTAVLPDGTMGVLMSIPNFSFDWQMKYSLKEPIALPKGAVLLVEGAFDNSASNPSNPDPTKEVRVGLESWDEMFVGYFNYTSAKPDARRDETSQ